MIYFDNAATTKPCPQAVEAITAALTEGWANPSALYRFGIDAARSVRAARQSVARAMGADTDRVFFTSCGSEADNWAVMGAALRQRKRGRHVITTAVEHSAIGKPMARLEEEGWEVTRLAPDSLGRISPRQLEEALRPDTVLVSVMMVNNESGAVMPIEAMARLTHRLSPNALFHTDAVQGFFKVPFRARTLGADMISISGHKVHGPKGIGALYLRPGLQLPPLILGGGQEGGLRSGTESVPLILGLGAACEAALPHRMEYIARESALRDRLRAGLEAMEGVVLVGAQEAPHIVNLGVPGLRSQGLLNGLQEEGICVSAGSACSKGHRSPVLEAMGVDPAVIDGSIRVSLSHLNTEAEADFFLEALGRVMARLR